MYNTIQYNFIHLKITNHFVTRSDDLQPIFTSWLECASKKMYYMWLGENLHYMIFHRLNCQQQFGKGLSSPLGTKRRLDWRGQGKSSLEFSVYNYASIEFIPLFWQSCFAAPLFGWHFYLVTPQACLFLHCKNK